MREPSEGAYEDLGGCPWCGGSQARVENVVDPETPSGRPGCDQAVACGICGLRGPHGKDAVAAITHWVDLGRKIQAHWAPRRLPTATEVFDALSGTITGPSVARAFSEYHRMVFGGGEKEPEPEPDQYHPEDIRSTGPRAGWL